MKITLLSGYLGSGKTTILSEWVNSDKADDVGVIVNEVGDINIDSQILISSNPDTSVIRLTSGCLCCTLKDDLTQCILNLVNASKAGNGHINNIVIEMSGLALPAPIVSSLLDRDLLHLDLRLNIVTVFDCVNGLRNINDNYETLAQLIVANSIVLNKLDLVSKSEINNIVNYLKTINPDALIVCEEIKSHAALQAFGKENNNKKHDLDRLFEITKNNPDHYHSEVHTSSFKINKTVDYDDLCLWLEDLSYQFKDSLLRAKFIVNIAESTEPVLVQSVGHIFSQPQFIQANDQIETSLVFIYRGTTKIKIFDAVNELFNQYALETH